MPTPSPVTCRFCSRVRPRRVMDRVDHGWQCKDEAGCAEFGRWTGGGEGR